MKYIASQPLQVIFNIILIYLIKYMVDSTKTNREELTAHREREEEKLDEQNELFGRLLEAISRLNGEKK